MSRITRRTFLRRAGGAALALPLLQLPRRAFGQQNHPTRLVIFYQPNGTKKELWSPQGGTETEWEPGPLIAPLARHRRKLVLLDGVDLTVAKHGPGGPHQRGMASALTAEIITEGDFVGGDGRRAGWAGGPSIDQVLATALRPDTPLSTLELGVRARDAEPRGRMIYRGREQPVTPINDPIIAYDRLFGGMLTEPDPDRAAARLARRQSVLDAVAGDFAELQRKVTAEDRQKLDQHATALRDLERRLALIAERPEHCRPPLPGAMDDVMSEAWFGEVMRAQIDLLVDALACDVTRYASLQASTALNALRFTFMGLVDNEGHALSHAGNSTEHLQAQWERMLLWYSEQLAYLLDRLDAVPEGDGTLLDHTLVLAFNELSRGNTHSHDDIPFILAGGANGRLRGGRHLEYDHASHSDLLVSVLNFVGHEVRTFGNPEFCKGPLPGL